MNMRTNTIQTLALEIPTNPIDVALRTVDGSMIHPFVPEADVVDIALIARSLSNICRWGGRLSRFYSVAQHCVICSYLAEDEAGIEVAKAALLHDAAEMYLGDIPRPFKRHMPNYQDVEARILAHIFAEMELDPLLVHHPKLHLVDDEVNRLEGTELFPDVKGRVPNIDARPNPMGPNAAYASFARRAMELFDLSEADFPDL